MTTAVILVSRDLDRTERVLAQLAGALSAPHELWTIAVGAGASSRARLALAEPRPGGFAAALALEAARLAGPVELAVVLGDEAEPAAGALDAVVARFAREPELAFVASGSACVARTAALDQAGGIEPSLDLEAAISALARRASARGLGVDLAWAAPRRFGIASEAELRVFAWPEWRDGQELAALLDRFARRLVGRAEACLCLRRDPALDPGADQVLAALAAEHARVLGRDAALDVLIVDDALGPADAPELARAIDVAVALPSSRGGERAVLYASLGRKVVHDPEAFARAIGAAAGERDLDRDAPAPRSARGRPGAADSELARRIEELHPWFYPVTLGGLEVAAGVGSNVAPDYLENRAACRKTLLVDEVARRYDLRGKWVLELACNCAYWSARYAELGATRVVGLEGREAYVRQAQLYWSTNRFLPQGSYEFLRGNVSDAGDWAALCERGPFDLVLCAGILYHVPNYREVLRWAAELAREVLIVDTRVGDGDETPIEEPGELHFNAIRETRRKVVPNRARLAAALGELGFAVETLPVGFRAQLGVEDVDDYAAGRAVTLLARRVEAPLAAGRSLLRGAGAR